MNDLVQIKLNDNSNSSFTQQISMKSEIILTPASA